MTIQKERLVTLSDKTSIKSLSPGSRKTAPNHYGKFRLKLGVTVQKPKTIHKIESKALSLYIMALNQYFTQ